MRGIILRVDPDATGGVILAADGRLVTFDAGAVEGRTYELERGCIVDFEPAAHGAAKVRIVSPPSAADARGGSLEPAPETVEDDKVELASWDSFPASDPPSYARSGKRAASGRTAGA